MVLWVPFGPSHWSRLDEPRSLHSAAGPRSDTRPLPRAHLHPLRDHSRLVVSCGQGLLRAAQPQKPAPGTEPGTQHGLGKSGPKESTEGLEILPPLEEFTSTRSEAKLRCSQARSCLQMRRSLKWPPKPLVVQTSLFTAAANAFLKTLLGWRNRVTRHWMARSPGGLRLGKRGSRKARWHSQLCPGSGG